ncbi:iron-containing redox enzyme family protein [Spongiactinospora sp. TRM90649]|uniref:iron-containing redox enzyme family protein n=1 Tax=Spongiactinospora sp. TRM90649 TaxID=3031114 RepID=UPI0023F9332A|nr:iron-containing redox enzyme family protein [Spongiactinospora sp. TRM90649]MDF5759100.1 iron-containing redox enzyme family protein [Spongiactinospora sp. TRM90649]
MIGAGEALRAKIELVLPGYLATVRAMWDGDAAARYPGYLAMLHTVMRASVPLLEAALAECRARADRDPVAGRLAGYYARHAREERGHDEWVRQDLAALGEDPDGPLAHAPGAAVAGLVGAQYYWLRHYHPCSLLGYIAVVEGYPPSPGWVGWLRRTTGHPAAAFRTLTRHAELDPGHRDDLYRLLGDLPLTPEQESAIGLSALHTLRGLIALLGTGQTGP